MIPPIVIFTATEDERFLEDIAASIKEGRSEKESTLLLAYPTVYIHYWPGRPIKYVDKKGQERVVRRFNVYVGESNDVVSRTKEHYNAGQKDSNWQYNLTHGEEDKKIVIIGHPHFNKSFTLDLENRLIDYIAPGNIENFYNARGNPQNEYYPVGEFEEVFQLVWRGLRKVDKELFLSLADIEKTAFFKASPLKKLTQDQLDAKEEIIAKVYDALENGKDGQLIFVQGEAGTGKTVLNSALFYDLITNGEEYFGRKIDCHMMVNHDQQLSVYEQIVRRLNLGEGLVHKPTSFINSYSERKKVDVSFIDEGHLLLTQGKQSYTGHNQLEDIIQRSRVTVIMFDEYQVLTSEEYWEPEVLNRYKELSYSQRNIIGLSSQLRMSCSPSTLRWINDFVLNRHLSLYEKDPKYDLRLFDSPEALQKAIEEKAKEDSLSRLVASYDWPYSSKDRPVGKPYWDVRIGSWSMPWNYETLDELTPRERRHIKSQAWAEQAHTLHEVGSTFTIQGFDLAYVGVILGPSVKYISNEVVFDPQESFNAKAKQRRTLNNGQKKSFGATFIRNEVKVLLTRGVKGLYIYACDPGLREAFKTVAGL